MDTDSTEKTPETAEDQPKQETPASGQGVTTANSRGALIRKIRLSREKPLSCAELAGLIGVSTATMSLIERDKCPVNEIRLAKIAKVLSIPLDVLQKEKGAVVSTLTAWQQYLKDEYDLDDEELSALLQIAIDAKLYRYDVPDTRSLDQWERFYTEMRNFLPRTTVQDRMLQDKAVLQRIGRRGKESAEEALNRYLSGIDAIVEPIIQKLDPCFNNVLSDPFSTLYLAAICKSYRIKIIAIENKTNTDVVKQQLFSLNIPEAIGSFFSLSDDPDRNTATHIVENAPDGIRRYLILHDKRNHKAVDSAHKLWRAITEILLGPDRMGEENLSPGIDWEPIDWLHEESIARVEFPPSALSRLMKARMSPLAKENPLAWMDGLQTDYAPQFPESRVFRAFTRQTPFPLCYFGGSFRNEKFVPVALKIDYFCASPEAAEKGMLLSSEIPLKRQRRLFKQFEDHLPDSVMNEVLVFDNVLVADFGLPESFIGTPIRIVMRSSNCESTVEAFLVPEFTNAPEKDPYADW